MFHLALSKNKKFWNKSFKNIYLGPWMMPEILKENFSDYDLIIPAWHWDNVDKFYDDSLKIIDSYEKFIVKLAEVLNELHGINWNLRAWKILCGPWLRRYLTIIYERNETIFTIYNSYNLTSCTVKNFSLMNLQIKDFDDFSESYKKEDYNNILYNYILKKTDKEKKIKFTELSFENKEIIKNYKKNRYFLSKKKIKKIFLSKYFNFILSLFFKRNNYYFQAIYLKSKLEQIKLNFKLKNFPYVKLINVETKDEKKFDKILRNKFYESIKKKFDFNKDNSYENLAIDLIYHMFPRCYLENFKINDEFSSQVFKHHDPKIIIDSASYQKDELFKFWIAKKTQKDVKFVILQHGGYYENFKFKPDLIGHELDITDKYLSWGWKENLYNIETVACPIPFKKIKNKKDKNIVNIILRTTGHYANNLSTHDIPSKNAETYINSVIDIANSISNDKKLKIFLHPGDNSNEERGFSLKPYLEKKIYNKDIEFFYGKINKHINYTNLNIFTYIGTPYNQALSSNIPCVVYNNEKYEPLNNKYRPLYNSMIKNKLMHTNILSLTNHINKNNDTIHEWWNKNEVIKSKNIFCKNFAGKMYDLEKLKKTIQDII